jgi:hypothetical protein
MIRESDSAKLDQRRGGPGILASPGHAAALHTDGLPSRCEIQRELDLADFGDFGSRRSAPIEGLLASKRPRSIGFRLGQ